jgi:Flp pilus assembly protein TadG
MPCALRRASLWRCRRGNVAIMVGLTAIPLIAMIGGATDLAQVWLVKSRLQVGLDAGVLVAAKIIGTTPAGTTPNTTDAINLFWSNFDTIHKPDGSWGGFMGATASKPIIKTNADGSVQMTSSATVRPSFLGVINIGTVTVNGQSTARTAAYGLELALVLDNTGSMAGSSISGLITASQQLLDIVYGPSNDTQPHLWVSVVPFAVTVNIKNTRTGWLVPGSLNPTDYSPSTWMGCVMARTANTGATDGDDFNDIAPSAGHYFKPFLYPDTYHQYPSTAGLQYTDSKGKKQTWWYPGDNDWVPATWTKTGNEPDAGNTSVGPNLGCPSLPILPETASKTTVLATINKMVPVYRGGTIISLGLQAGWWTISQNWRGYWGDPNMPLNNNTPYMKKVIVLMTDGNNEWYDWNCGVPGQTPPATGCPWTTTPPTGIAQWSADGDADFTAYGRLKSNTRGLPTNNATTTLNNLMSTMCTTIKNQGIIIYTILFNNTNSATVSLFQSCASSPSNYFNSPNTAALQTAFRQIGSDLSTLRISQ